MRSVAFVRPRTVEQTLGVPVDGEPEKQEIEGAKRGLVE